MGERIRGVKLKLKEIKGLGLSNGIKGLSNDIKGLSNDIKGLSNDIKVWLVTGYFLGMSMAMWSSELVTRYLAWFGLEISLVTLGDLLAKRA